MSYIGWSSNVEAGWNSLYSGGATDFVHTNTGTSTGEADVYDFVFACGVEGGVATTVVWTVLLDGTPITFSDYLTDIAIDDGILDGGMSMPATITVSAVVDGTPASNTLYMTITPAGFLYADFAWGSSAESTVTRLWRDYAKTDEVGP